MGSPATTLTGWECGCGTDRTPGENTRPAVVLDPFGGTGTTAAVARALGRHGISVDLSGDYCRLAQWRTTEPKLEAKVRDRTWPQPKPARQAKPKAATGEQPDLFETV